MNSYYLNAIKDFEGFAAAAKADYAQLTNGYGTRAAFAGEIIDRAEADRRFAAEIAAARAIVEHQAPTADEGTKAALTSLTFNAGEAWTRSGLGAAIRSGDLDTARALFLQYDKAGGQVLAGLATRRACEAQWIGHPLDGPRDINATDGPAVVPAALAHPVPGPPMPPPVAVAVAVPTDAICTDGMDHFLLLASMAAAGHRAFSDEVASGSS